MKMKSLVILSFCVLLVACNKGSEKDETTDTLAAQVQKKWVLNSNSLHYSWIEFAKANHYIIQLEDGSSKAGTYTLSAAAKQLVLKNLVTLSITNISDDALSFSLTLNGTSTPILAGGTPVPPIDGSAKTDLLSQYWNLYKETRIENGISETELYPQTNQNGEGRIKLEVIFTQFGTYFVTDIEKTATGYDTSYFNQMWKWNNAAETTFEYFNASGSNRATVTIEELTSKSLRMTEENPHMIYYLNR